MSIPTQIPTDDRAFVIAGATAEDAQSSAEALLAESPEGQTHYPLDPNVVIAEAFKAAGLPVPASNSAARRNAARGARSDHRGGFEGRRTGQLREHQSN